MIATDIRLLCSALGFAVVAIQGGRLPKKTVMLRAADYARQIEEFCRFSLPKIFEDASSTSTSTNSAKFSVTERMANAIVTIIRETGGCLPQDVIAKGFTYDEVNRHWAMAKALAYVELNIMDS
ncbi:MAG: hypothetical protein SFW62_05815 [Alphaproteobacteria bacterium]|nr:hypothetical protein [Alphaproteobacteria bacterium]